MNEDWLESFIRNALDEDLGDGDHSSLASIDPGRKGKSRLIIKEQGILAGIEVAARVFSFADPSLIFEPFIPDGRQVSPGEIAFQVSGNVHSMLKCERLVLNIMQRMSGIATQTRCYTDQLKGLRTRILDTRKTTPGMRMLEKTAVVTGGGENHRMGLFDMIMLKDNHIDCAGGIKNAIEKTRKYLEIKKLRLKVEIEVRNLDELDEVLSVGGVDRIMLDNFSIAHTMKAVEMVSGRVEIESSGGINLKNIRDYALCGVDYISVGALTHQFRSLDMSLKTLPDN